MGKVKCLLYVQCRPSYFRFQPAALPHYFGRKTDFQP